jgi:hypothetical protein
LSIRNLENNLDVCSDQDTQRKEKERRDGEGERGREKIGR